MERRKYILAGEFYNVLMMRSCNETEYRSNKINDSIKFLIDGEFLAARNNFYRLCRLNPCDAFSFYTCHMIEFNNGMLPLMLESLNIVNSLDKQHFEFYGFYKGIESFILNENKYYDDAFACGREAIGLNVNDIYAIHAICHYYYDTGQYFEGIKFMDNMQVIWANNYGMRLHLLWHYALFLIKTKGDDNSLEKTYNLLRMKNSPGDLEDLDIASLSFRLVLSGKSDKFNANFLSIANSWSNKEELGFYFFNDFHAALIFGLTKNLPMINFLIKSVEYSYPYGYIDEKRTLLKAIKAYCFDDFLEVVNLLDKPVDYSFMGGSNAQRSIIYELLNKCKINTGVGNDY